MAKAIDMLEFPVGPSYRTKVFYASDEVKNF